MWVSDTLDRFAESREEDQSEEQTVSRDRGKKMMNHMTSYGMMAGVPLLWIVISFLLALLLVAALTWLWASRHNEQRFSEMQAASPLQDTSGTYEQRYREALLSPEVYQESGQRSSYPQSQDEEPIAQYPQEMPLQQR